MDPPMNTPFYMKMEHSKDDLFQKMLGAEKNKIRDNPSIMDNFRDETIISNGGPVPLEFRKQTKKDSNFSRPLMPTYMPSKFFHNNEHHDIEKDNEIRPLTE